MALKNDFRVPFEQANLSMECTHCGAELIINPSKPADWSKIKGFCSICNRDYAHSTSEVLVNLLNFLSTAQRLIKETGVNVFLMVPRPN